MDRPDSVSVSGLDAVCKLVRTEIAKVGTTIMVHVRDYNKVEVMTTYLPDFSAMSCIVRRRTRRACALAGVTEKLR